VKNSLVRIHWDTHFFFGRIHWDTHFFFGYKAGTGGSSGVHFLKKALDVSFFPELLSVRTDL